MASQLSIVKAGWDAPKNVIAFSTTRMGGYSYGDFDSFNLGLHVGDEHKLVVKNRQRLNAHFKLPTEPAWLEQTHSISVIELGSVNPQPLIADGSITTNQGVVCAVMTADCLPLFLCNKEGTKVGVIHVGWRGLADGIIEHAITRMDTPAKNLIAWAGPCICVNHFEISSTVRQQLGGSDKYYSLSSNKNKCNADLYGLAGERLANVGIENYSHSTACTYTDKENFYSHRRDNLTGRMASIIYLV